MCLRAPRTPHLNSSWPAMIERLVASSSTRVGTQSVGPRGVPFFFSTSCHQSRCGRWPRQVLYAYALIHLSHAQTHPISAHAGRTWGHAWPAYNFLALNCLAEPTGLEHHLRLPLSNHSCSERHAASRHCQLSRCAQRVPMVYARRQTATEITACIVQNDDSH